MSDHGSRTSAPTTRFGPAQRMAAVVIGVVATLGLAGCVTAPTAPGATSRTGAPTSKLIAGQQVGSSPPADAADPHRAIALAAVTRLLASVTLPPGAQQVGISPTRSLDAVDHPPSPTLIDAVQWWTVPEKGGGVLPLGPGLLPAGVRFQGSTHLPTLTTARFSSPVIDPAFTNLQVEVTQSDYTGGSAIRIDAMALWVPSRSAAETIPGNVRSVAVTLKFHGRTLRRVATGAPAIAIGRALNALQPAPERSIAGGPMEADTGFEDDLVFHVPGRPDVVVVLTVDGPFAGASVTVAGRRQTTLAGFGTPVGPLPKSLDAAIVRALGLPSGARK